MTSRPAAPLPPLTIFTARRIHTMDDSLPEATAVAVSEGRIVAVGDLASMAPWREGRQVTVDERFADMVLMPGLIDNHIHPFLGALLMPTEHIAPEPWRQATAMLEHAPWLVANLTLAGLPQDNGHSPLAWDNVLYDSPGLGYVVATHQHLRQHEPATVITYYQALSHTTPKLARQQLLNTSHAGWRQQILQTLAAPHPQLAQQLQRLDIWRWGHAMARPTPGLISSSALAALQSDHHQVQLAHADLSGFSLFEEAQYWGVRAAEQALKQLA